MAREGVHAVIVAVCSDKGAPGVTMLATVLALSWPGERLLLEADPSGGDLALRMHAPGAHYLAREPTTLSLATAVRSGARGAGLAGYAQATSLGFAVIPGPPVAEAWTPMLNLWEPVAAEVQDWDGTIVADLGRLHPGHPGWPVAEAADVVLLVTTASVDALFHARERVQVLERLLGEGRRRSPVGVVVRAAGKDSGALGDVSRVLQTLVPVVGGFAHDPGGVKILLAGSVTPQLRRSPLMRSGVDLVARIQRTWRAPERDTGAHRWSPRVSGSPQPPTDATIRLVRDLP